MSIHVPEQIPCVESQNCNFSLSYLLVFPEAQVLTYLSLQGSQLSFTLSRYRYLSVPRSGQKYIHLLLLGDSAGKSSSGKPPFLFEEGGFAGNLESICFFSRIF